METEDKANSTSAIPSNEETLAEKAVSFVADALIKRPEIPKEERLAKLSDEQKQQLQEVIDRTICDAHGQLDELESALGMLLIGHHFGWKVLYLIHSKKTIRKYEGFLGIRVREFFPERGPSSPRSYGLAFADKLSNFWKVVSGDTPIPDRRKIE